MLHRFSLLLLIAASAIGVAAFRGLSPSSSDASSARTREGGAIRAQATAAEVALTAVAAPGPRRTQLRASQAGPDTGSFAAATPDQETFEVTLTVRLGQPSRWTASSLILVDGSAREWPMAPLAGPQVRFTARECARVADLPAGSYTLIHRDSSALFPFSVTGSGDHFEFTVGELSDIVVFPVRGDGAEFQGSVVARGRGLAAVHPISGHQVDGALRFALAPGVFTFEARARDGAFGRERFEVGTGPADVIIEVDPPEFWTLDVAFVENGTSALLPDERARSVRFLGAGGGEVDGTPMLLRRPSGPFRASLASGRVDSPPLAEGACGIRLRGRLDGTIAVVVPGAADDDGSIERLVDLRRGETTKLQIDLETR